MVWICGENDLVVVFVVESGELRFYRGLKRLLRGIDRLVVSLQGRYGHSCIAPYKILI